MQFIRCYEYNQYADFIAKTCNNDGPCDDVGTDLGFQDFSDIILINVMITCRIDTGKYWANDDNIFLIIVSDWSSNKTSRENISISLLKS